MKNLKEKLKFNLIIVTYIILLTYILLNITKIWNIISTLLGILSPFITAIGIAFVLNIPMTLIETYLLFFLDKPKYSKFKGFKRPFSIMLTFSLILGLLATLLFFVIPELINSISLLTDNFPTYIDTLEKTITSNPTNIPFMNKFVDDFLATWQDLLQTFTKFIGIAASSLLNATISITSSIINFFLSLVFTVYMLANKENLLLIVKKLIYAHIKTNWADKIFKIASISNQVFSKFIGGQCLEGCIIGTLCTIGMLILRLPYALLIGVIIGVTSLIPIFGAFIGTIPAAFIIFMIKPIKAIIFIIFILVLQQVEGNFIYPKVVGNSIGLSAIWVMFAMLIGGSLFGLLGFVLGIPTFAVIYRLVRFNTYKNLDKKNIKI